jgi:glutathione S-transferase
MFSPAYTLYHASGMGSTYTLALLQLLNIPYVLKTMEFVTGPIGTTFKNDDSRATYMEMKQHNPLGQFPTLVKSDGVVLTEMAAIALCEPFQSVRDLS